MFLVFHVRSVWGNRKEQGRCGIYSHFYWGPFQRGGQLGEAAV